MCLKIVLYLKLVIIKYLDVCVYANAEIETLKLLQQNHSKQLKLSAQHKKFWETAQLKEPPSFNNAFTATELFVR